MESYFKNAIVFYYKYLLEQGVDDPIRVIIGDFISTVKITKEQQEYIKNMSDKEFKMIENIIILISKMKLDKKYDEKSLDLIQQGLSNLKRG